MQRIVWLSDIHLDFLDRQSFNNFVNNISIREPTSIIISGDISTSSYLITHLTEMEKILQIPIYFVLGNHDYFNGSIESTRKSVLNLSNKIENIKYLPNLGVVKLNNNTCLIGHGSWYDGRYGDYLESYVRLNDFYVIHDFMVFNKFERLTSFQKLANEALEYFKETIPKALEEFNNLIIVTHVSPFKETACYNGRQSDDDWLPFFSCKIVGDFLKEIMEKNSEKEMTVYCGHSHGRVEFSILPNLLVKGAGAVYYSPEIQEIIEILD